MTIMASGLQVCQIHITRAAASIRQSSRSRGRLSSRSRLVSSLDACELAELYVYLFPLNLNRRPVTPIVCLSRHRLTIAFLARCLAPLAQCRPCRHAP